MRSRRSNIISLTSSSSPSSAAENSSDSDNYTKLRTPHSHLRSNKTDNKDASVTRERVNAPAMKGIREEKRLLSIQQAKPEIRKKQVTLDSFNRSPSVEILSPADSRDQVSNDESIEYNNSSDDNAQHSQDSPIEVPDSSPLKIIRNGNSVDLDSSPIKPAKTKLTNLKAFAYKDPESKNDDMKKSKLASKKVFEMLKTFRKNYPHLTQRVILKALNTMNSLSEIKTYLDGLPKVSTSSLTSRGTVRLSGLNDKSAPLLSSSPIKKLSSSELRLQSKNKTRELERLRARQKAERENIKSSKVVLDSKKSIKDRFVTKRRRLYREEQSEEEAISLDDSESSEAEESEGSVEEVSAKKSGKRRYENDEDYTPKGTKKLKLRKKTVISSNTKSKDREVRAQRRLEVEKLLPELEEDDDINLNVNERLLRLFNNADILDIIDLSNIKPIEAEIIIKNRPFNTVNEFLKLNLKPGNKSKVANSARIYSERVIETCKEKLIAYGAIDSLVKQCFSYSKSITKEIVKWGVNVEGQAVNGEVSITEVNASESDSESEAEQNNNTEEKSESESDSGSDSDIQVIKNPKRRNFNYDDVDDYGDVDNEYGESKKIYKSNLNISNVKDKIAYFHKSPKLLKKGVKLKNYQQVGINWLSLLFQKQLSCILADEMGLGKTIQVIAFIGRLKQKGYLGPHLIVVPSSTLENWLREFQNFAPSIDVVPYYGSLAEREELRSVLLDEKFDVMITTYNLATVGKLDQPFLRSFEFNTIVYDEGHMLKNASSDRYKKLTKLRAHFRILLTGTPLQNNLRELISLLDFILPEIFDPKMSQLELLFDKKASTKNSKDTIEGEAYNPLLSQQAIAKAKVMMAPFILRRTKAQVMNDLPEKHSSIEYTDLLPHQRRIYDDQLKNLDEFRKERDRRKSLTSEVTKKLPPLKAKSANALMALRKVCLHPLLFRYHYNDQLLRIMAKAIMKNDAYIKADEEYIFEDMQVMSDFELATLCHQFPNELGKYVLKQSSYMDSGKVQSLIKILKDIIEKGEKVLIFSLFTQVLDILEKVLSLQNWKFLRLDGATAVETRQSLIDKFYEDKTIPVFLLSTKAGGFGINLICATNVIIFDQSFNPHDDKQAEDRAHRVGQTKEVFVTRLITKNTIEENILQLAYNKLQLDQSMMKKPTEDVLLKTVEDILSSKDNAKTDETLKEESPAPEREESVFESNIDMEIIAQQGKEYDDDIQVIEPVIDNQNNERSKRRRKNITYVDNIDMQDLIESDSDNEKVNESGVVELKSDSGDKDGKDCHMPDEDEENVKKDENSSFPNGFEPQIVNNTDPLKEQNSQLVKSVVIEPDTNVTFGRSSGGPFDSNTTSKYEKLDEMKPKNEEKLEFVNDPLSYFKTDSQKNIDDSPQFILEEPNTIEASSPVKSDLPLQTNKNVHVESDAMTNNSPLKSDRVATEIVASNLSNIMVRASELESSVAEADVVTSMDKFSSTKEADVDELESEASVNTVESVVDENIGVSNTALEEPSIEAQNDKTT